MTRRSLLIIGVLAGVLLFTVLALSPVEYAHRNRPDACVVGDVAARLAARVPPALQNRWLDAGAMQFGLGTASVNGWDGLGDALVAGGQAWQRNTARGTPEYFGSLHGRHFQTSHFLYVPPGVRPQADWSPPAGGRIGELWAQLADIYPGGVLVEGYAHFDRLRLLALARPPIDGRALPPNIPYYYEQPMESMNDSWAYVVGIAADPSRPATWPSAFGGDQRKLLLRALPAPRRGEPAGFVHALALSAAPTRAAAPAPASVLRVGQLAMSSTMRDGTLHLYPLHRIAACDDVEDGR